MDDRSPHSTTDQANQVWDGAQLLAALTAAAHWLEQHADAVNALNVFPVPDGDTGTNMALTLNGAVRDVAPDPSVAVVAEKVKYWAMMRGRGNSGIILSQVLRGIANGLEGHDLIGAPELAAALAQASVSAYRAVLKPVEGTMLTVIREASEAATAALAAPDASALMVLAAATQAARESVDRTPQLLKTLADAGVVDSGGEGLFLILEGLLRYARGESIEYQAAAQPAAMAFEDIHGPDDFGYCTNFILRGEHMPFDAIRAALAEMGQSAVIVGDEQLIKVHIHVLRPGDALNYAIEDGALEQIEIANMDVQREQLHQSRTEGQGLRAEFSNERPTLSPQSSVLYTEVGIVAVAPGAGFAEIFRSLHAGEVVGGGQTMNPSTEDLLAAIARLPQQDVIVLPNNSNVIMAARQAAELSDKHVEVLPTRTAPQGLAALLGFNYQATIADNLRTMTAAMQQTQTAEITTAVRDAEVDGVTVRSGQAIGLLDGDVVTASDDRHVVLDVLLKRMDLDQREIVTIYYGGATSLDDAQALAEHIQERYDGLEVEVQDGGQPLYDYIISAE
ncbi:MAG TPA: DAK2 domain-containing protein [Roseiflexaceae bacterium]|nr:DAK2 domain-containing protein [Roseiflexaceae bacterium]